MAGWRVWEDGNGGPSVKEQPKWVPPMFLSKRVNEFKLKIQFYSSKSHLQTCNYL